jgi:hypothetical protein
VHLFNFCFLAQLAAMQHELQATQEAAAGSSNTSGSNASNTEDGRVQRPKKIKNLQAAMSLSNDPMTYQLFRVGPFFILTKCIRTQSLFIG